MWNTLVLVVRCKILLQAIQRATPELYRSFEPIQNAIGTADQQRVIEEVYHKLPSLNFSKGVLEVLSFEHRQALVVLTVSGVTWSDWGTNNRLSSMLRVLGESDYVKPERLLSEGRALPVSSANQYGSTEEDSIMSLQTELDKKANSLFCFRRNPLTCTPIFILAEPEMQLMLSRKTARDRIADADTGNSAVRQRARQDRCYIDKQPTDQRPDKVGKAFFLSLG